MSGRIALSVTFSSFARLFPGGLGDLMEAARVADSTGVDQLALPDHLAIGPNTAAYPYGRFPLPPDEPWPEPLTTLAAMAAVTRRVRLATGVLVAPLRPALLLAKTAATLDVLSGGRLDLGVGVGWQREEFAGSPVPFEQRWRGMDDALRACRVLWRDSPASFSSPTLRFEGLYSLPHPVQAGGVPLWFGVRLSPRNVARIAELGAGWLPIAPSEEELREGSRTLREAFTAAGRDPASLGVRATLGAVRGPDGRPDLARSLEALPRLHEAGATIASLALPAFARSPEEVRPFLEQLGRAAG